MKKMASSKQFREPELELAEALTDADRKRGLLRHSPDCSSDKELRLFVAGRSSRPDAILAHLGDCPRCVQLLPRLRARAVRIKQASLALAGIAIIVVAAWLMLILPARFSTFAGRTGLCVLFCRLAAKAITIARFARRWKAPLSPVALVRLRSKITSSS